MLVGRQFGVMATVGHKTDGFVPGCPVSAGTYGGGGVVFSPFK